MRFIRKLLRANEIPNAHDVDTAPPPPAPEKQVERDRKDRFIELALTRNAQRREQIEKRTSSYVDSLGAAMSILGGNK